MNKEIIINTLDLFNVIKIALGKVNNINKSWVKPSCGSDPIHFTKLDSLKEADKVKFVESIVLIHGEINSTAMKGIQRKQQSSTMGYMPIDIELSFKSDEEKRKYFGYHLALVGIEENIQESAEAEID
jgi:hypothetical protein